MHSLFKNSILKSNKDNNNFKNIDYKRVRKIKFLTPTQFLDKK